MTLINFIISDYNYDYYYYGENMTGASPDNDTESQ